MLIFIVSIDVFHSLGCTQFMIDYLSDARQAYEYEESHIITAKKAPVV